MEKIKVYAVVNYGIGYNLPCYFSGKGFEPGNIIFEVRNEAGDRLGDASPEEAIKMGFTVASIEDWSKIDNLIGSGGLLDIDLETKKRLYYRVVTPTDKVTVNSLPGAILTLTTWDEDYALPEPDIEDAIDKNGFWESKVEDIAIYQIYAP